MDKPRIIKVFEDTQLKLNLNEQEKNDILAIRNIIGENNLILQADGKLLISHYVGFIHVNNTRVLIYPKIARNVQGEDFYNKAFNILVKMLAYTGFVQVKRINTPQNIARYDNDILELLIGVFVDELLSLFKRDINRSYRITIENESFIKGKIDFTQNVKKNSYRKHLHSLIYEQFTENILMNRIFKTVVLNLVKKTMVKENKMKLGQALLWLEDVEQIKITDDIWDQVTFTRLNHQYSTVFNMAKLFYHNSSINLNKGDEVTFSFLIPVNQLFERYVFKMLSGINLEKMGYTVMYQSPVRSLGYIDGKEYYKLRPDISVVKGNQVMVIFDAKYKEIIDADGNNLVLQSDIYQMLAYSVKYNCNQIVLVYPWMLGCRNNNSELFTIEISKGNGVLVIKVMQIDLESDVEDVKKELSQFCQIIIEVAEQSGRLKTIKIYK